MNQFTIVPPLGLNNVDTTYKTPKIEHDRWGNFSIQGELASCLNYRILKDSSISVRNGFTKKYTGTDVHSYWTNEDGTLALFVDGTNLKKLNTDYTATTIQAGLTAKMPMGYVEHKILDNTGVIGKWVFMGNKFQMLKYDGTTVSLWGNTDPFVTSRTGDEFEYPKRTYQPPPPSNIFISHYARIVLADGRFALFSEPRLPETFRRAINFPSIGGDITALSRDNQAIYIHSYEGTKIIVGRDPELDDIYEIESPIGAIKQNVISPLGFPIFMSRYGWALATPEGIKYVDKEQFELDLPSTAIAYLGYNKSNREVICTIKQ